MKIKVKRFRKFLNKFQKKLAKYKKMWYNIRRKMNIGLKEWVNNPLFRIVKEVSSCQKSKIQFLRFPIL